MEIIVFNNDELVSALVSGVKDICLCDNTFDIPNVPNTVYSAIGDTTVTAPSLAECEGKNIVFLNFTPDYAEGNSSGVCKKASDKPAMSSGGSQSSYRSSYRLSGFYSMSYAASYGASYTGSYRLVSSYTGSYGSRFKSDNNVIYVNGYGIDLI